MLTVSFEPSIMRSPAAGTPNRNSELGLDFGVPQAPKCRLCLVLAVAQCCKRPNLPRGLRGTAV